MSVYYLPAPMSTKERKQELKRHKKIISLWEALPEEEKELIRNFLKNMECKRRAKENKGIR